MEVPDQIEIYFRFIQKSRNSVTQLNSKKFLCGPESAISELIENVSEIIFNTAILYEQYYKNKRTLKFNFNRKFDVELNYDYEFYSLSSLRKGELISFQIPSIDENEEVYERKLATLKEQIYVVFDKLIRSVLHDKINSYPDSTETEQLLIKRFEYNELSDYQKYLLLKGLKESEPRQIAKRFENNGYKFLPEDQINAEAFFDKLITKYGTEFLVNIVNLPEKPFSNKTVQRLFDAMSKIEGEIVRLTFDGSATYEFKLKDEEITVICDNKVLSKINRQGDLNLQSNNTREKYFSTTLMLYFARNKNEELLYFGQQMGTCSFCKKPLEDPISLHWGYGKTCADRFNLPWG